MSHGAGPVEVDVVVLGLGPAGESAANKLARAGLEVVAVDKHLAGGECPFYGCGPSKIMVRGAGVLAESWRVDDLSGTATTVPDWTPVARRVADHTDHWSDDRQVSRLEESGARVVRGRGRVVGEQVVAVDGAGEAPDDDRHAGHGAVFRARRGVVLATGTGPWIPDVDGLGGTPYWTNRDVARLDEVPASLAVLGAGPIGSELAQVFARFGSRVTVLESAERLLPAEEPEVGRTLACVFEREGIRVLTGAQVGAVAHDGSGFALSVPGETVTAQRLLVAVGRRPELPDLGLGTVGLDGDVAALDTDGRLRVLGRDGRPLPWLFAAGDITGRGAFTHVAKYQAAVLVRALLGKDGPEADYRAVPRVTFTDPEVGSVGLTEAGAAEQGRQVRTATLALSDSARGAMHGVDDSGLVKLVAEGDLLVGGTAMGPAGGEILAMLTTAVHARVPLSTLRTMMFAYPTWHGAVRQALAALG